MLPVTAPWISVTSSADGGASHPAVRRGQEQGEYRALRSSHLVVSFTEQEWWWIVSLASQLPCRHGAAHRTRREARDQLGKWSAAPHGGPSVDDQTTRPDRAAFSSSYPSTVSRLIRPSAPLRKSLRRAVAARARSGPPALTRCRLVAMNASRPCSSQGRGNRTEPRREELGITSQQRETEAEGHVFVVVRRPPDAVGRGELRGRVLLHPGPRHPGRVDEGHVGAELVEHLNLGDGGLVADVRDATLEERVHEGGLPHVGDAEDHHAQRLVGPAAVGSQRATGRQDAIDLARLSSSTGRGPARPAGRCSAAASAASAPDRPCPIC